MKKSIYIYHKVRQVIHIIGAIFLFLFFFITLINVIARYIFNAPIAIGDELAFYLFFYGGMIGIYYGYSQKVHVSVDLIKSKLSRPINGWLELFTSIIAGIIWIIIFWQGTLDVLDLITRTHTLHRYLLPLPLWCTVIGIPFTALLISIENLLSFLIPSINLLKSRRC